MRLTEIVSELLEVSVSAKSWVERFRIHAVSVKLALARRRAVDAL